MSCLGPQGPAGWEEPTYEAMWKNDVMEIGEISAKWSHCDWSYWGGTHSCTWAFTGGCCRAEYIYSYDYDVHLGKAKTDIIIVYIFVIQIPCPTPAWNRYNSQKSISDLFLEM